jgi:hypothetical protein
MGQSDGHPFPGRCGHHISTRVHTKILAAIAIAKMGPRSLFFVGGRCRDDLFGALSSQCDVKFAHLEDYWLVFWLLLKTGAKIGAGAGGNHELKITND